MISATLRRPQSLWRQHADWEATTALLVATSEVQTLLGSARRLAFAPPEVTDWLTSCTRVLEAAAQSLAAPLTPARHMTTTATPNGGGDLVGAASARVAEHARLVASINELAREAHRCPDHIQAAILLADEIGHLQLQLARHKTHLRDDLGDFGSQYAWRIMRLPPDTRVEAES